MPKLFRLTKAGALIEGIFVGDTINTPSMLCVEDALDGLRWAESVGGLPELIRRSEANLAVTAEWVAASNWVDFLAETPDTRSCTSMCLKVVDARLLAESSEVRSRIVKRLVGLLETEQIAYDVGSYRDAPTGLRLWGGATVEATDLEMLFPWLDWAFVEAMQTGW